jgi:hypothetical protein
LPYTCGDPAVEIYVNQRFRAHRLKLGISQVELARPIRIIFQQLQKNERALNCLLASRLYETEHV